MTKPTLIWTDIDYDREGKQVGTLHLPYSVTRSAYGTIAIPVAVIRNGAGPTLLLTAGNHGDEYEGQIALAKLIRGLVPAAIRGRVIVVPALNLPAAMAGTRVSPLDGGNLNRLFPGDPDRGPTSAIAHYLDSVLYPMADFTADLHSGGGSLDYLPFASMHEGANSDLNARSLAALKAFGAPISVIWKHADPRYSPGAATARGVPMLSGEFGGGGAVDRAALAFVEAGLGRLLAHLGMVEATGKPPGPTRMMAVPNRGFHVHAPSPGLFEPATELGQSVRAGELCGHVHFVDDPARPAVKCHFREAGIVVCKRRPARVERGDCVAHLAIDGTG